MTIDTMRTLETVIGIPLCVVLSLARSVGGLFRTRRELGPVRKVLVMKFFGRGSMLYATPLLKALRDAHPSAQIDFLTFEENRDLIRRFSVVDGIITLRSGSFSAFAFDAVRALTRIRRNGYDVAMDLEFFAKFSTIVTFLSGSPVRIGYYVRHIWRGNLLTHHVYFNPHHHITSVFAAMLGPLGVQRPHKLEPLAPAVTPEDVERAGALRAKEGRRSSYIVLNANAGPLSLERRWPGEYWQTLTAHLLRATPHDLVFIGGQEEVEHVASLVKALPSSERMLSMAGKTDLGELLAVLKGSAMVISNDSGPLHLAAALGRPTVGLFGPETPTLYGPPWDNALVLYAGVYCSPCINVYNAKRAECAGETVCLRHLTPERVAAEIGQHFPWFLAAER